MYSTKDAILKLLRAIKLKLVILHKRCDSIPAHSALSKIKLNNRFIRRAIERITLQEKLTENTLMCSDKAALTSFQQGKKKRKKERICYIVNNIHHKTDEKIELYLKKGDKLKMILFNKKNLSLSSIRQSFERDFDEVSESAIYVLDSCFNIEYEMKDTSEIKPYSVISIRGKCPQKKYRNT